MTSLADAPAKTTGPTFGQLFAALVHELARDIAEQEAHKDRLRRARSEDLTAELENIEREIQALTLEEAPSVEIAQSYRRQLDRINAEIARRIALAKASNKAHILKGGGLPPDFIPELKARVEIVDVAQRLGVHSLRYVRSDEWMGLCPNDRHNPGFHIYGEHWYCFCPRHACGGDVIELALQLRGGTWIEAVRWIGEGIGMKLPRAALPTASKGPRCVEGL